MKKLFLHLLLLSCIVLVASLIVDTIYRTYVDDDYPYPVLWYDKPIETPYDFVVLGNSHSQSGIVLDGIKRSGLQLSGVAQRFDFDLALLKQHKKQIKTGAVIIIPVTPISFSHKKPDQEDGFQDMYYSRMAPFLIPYIDVGNYIQAQITPFFRSGYLLRQWHAKNVSETVAAQEKWVEPTAPISPPGSASQELTESETLPTPQFQPLSVQRINLLLNTLDPARIGKHKDNINFVYNKWLNTDEFGQVYFEHNRRSLEEVISFAIQKGWQPVLVTIPLSAELVEALPDSYMQEYLYNNLNQTDLQNTEYIDFSNELEISGNNEFYSNADHLNDTGAIIFSYKLLLELIARGYLPKAADGYDYSIANPVE